MFQKAAVFLTNGNPKAICHPQMNSHCFSCSEFLLSSVNFKDIAPSTKVKVDSSESVLSFLSAHVRLLSAEVSKSERSYQ